MIATITNTTNTSFVLPIFNKWMTPHKVYSTRRSFAAFNEMLTGPRSASFLYLAKLGIISVEFQSEATDSYVPFSATNSRGVASVTAGAGLHGGTITDNGTLSVQFGAGPGTVCEGNDPRLEQVNAPGGPYEYDYGTPVAVYNGQLIPANAASAVSMPCVGLYTGLEQNTLKSLGEFAGLSGLTVDAPLYIGVGGGLVHEPPASAGSVVQYVGKALSSSSLFLTLMTPVE